MAIQYKFNILAELKSLGYNSSRIRKENIFGQSTLQAFRSNAPVSLTVVCQLCDIFNCDIGDLIHYIPNTVESPFPIPEQPQPFQDPVSEATHTLPHPSTNSSSAQDSYSISKTDYNTLLRIFSDLKIKQS